MKRNVIKRSSGFTLIELLVVVMIIGILAAIAVPQYFKVVERAKASEASAFLGEIKSAQERYLARYGQYAATTSGFDATMGTMKYFDFAMSQDNSVPSWTGTLTRKAPTPAIYGAYSVTITVPGGSPSTGNSTWDADLLQ